MMRRAPGQRRSNLTETVDGLVVVPDNAEVGPGRVAAGRWRMARREEQSEQFDLRGVDILELVDDGVPQLRPHDRRGARVLAEEPDGVQDQVVERQPPAPAALGAEPRIGPGRGGEPGVPLALGVRLVRGQPATGRVEPAGDGLPPALRECECVFGQRALVAQGAHLRAGKLDRGIQAGGAAVGEQPLPQDRLAHQTVALGRVEDRGVGADGREAEVGGETPDHREAEAVEG
jgi:hypothetical protein